MQTRANTRAFPARPVAIYYALLYVYRRGRKGGGREGGRRVAGELFELDGWKRRSVMGGDRGERGVLVYWN